MLLVRRSHPPRAGEWSVPGGAQNLGETAEAAARRELREEAGIEVGPLTLVACIDSLVHDESGAVRFHYTIIDYAARWQSGDPLAGDDASDARFFTPAELPALGLWEEAVRVIATARRRLAEN